VPSGLQAVFSGPGQQRFVDLIWAPVPDLDLAGYNVYRREDGKQAEKVNAEMVHGPSYRDLAVESGKNYFYTVTAVDARGNESSHSEEASERVP
jgi:fibronectin type 3 domain-containing protein